VDELASQLIPDIDPFDLFDEWFNAARWSEPNDGNAMALATATADGQPSVRMVLLKDHDRRGFVFYTNRESRKGQELDTNAQVALLFHWKSLRRQIRIEGRVLPVDASTADAYLEPPSEVILDAETPGLLLPEQPHFVEPLGPMRMHVEFYNQPPDV
jgi:pyridoxamine 5'-phosphate oxidase